MPQLTRTLKICATVALLTVLFPALGRTGTWVAFGPKTYTRGTGSPVTLMDTFTLLKPNTQYTLKVFNGGAEHFDRTRVQQRGHVQRDSGHRDKQFQPKRPRSRPSDFPECYEYAFLQTSQQCTGSERLFGKTPLSCAFLDFLSTRCIHINILCINIARRPAQDSAGH